ncbi:MAG TPA: flagellar export chaperone FliS [Polyangiaceae bacterium]|jgi:flagellar protein FliS|nr:flagellar export chaperone FliS [Polyangiaceae bacterium]
MLQNAVAQYRKVQVQTISQGELLLALYDGLFRFLNEAKDCLDKGDANRARTLNSKSYAILSELSIALDPEIAPELCANLQALYSFCMDRIRGANRSGTSQPLAEVIRVLTPLREAWQIAVPQAMKEGVQFGPRASQP